MKAVMFLEYRPAELRITEKETYIAFYALNPDSNRLERVRYRLNYIRSKTERTKYGKTMCAEINLMLSEGWNPFVDKAQGDNGGVTMKAAIAAYRKSWNNLRADSLRSYTSNLKTFECFADPYDLLPKPVSCFKTAQAARYMKHISTKTSSAKTYNNQLHFMRQVFNFFIGKGYCNTNPFNDIKPRRVDSKTRKPIPADIRKQIRTYLMDNGMNEFLNICLLTYECLIRPKEILQLRIRDYDPKTHRITIPAEVAKNHHERTVALAPDMVDFFDNLKGEKEWFIFSSRYKPGKKMLNTRDTGRTWSNMRKALGFGEEYQMYSLKDTGISEMLEAGVPSKLVKELADHHSLEMTERYIARSKADEILKYRDLHF